MANDMHPASPVNYTVCVTDGDNISNADIQQFNVLQGSGWWLRLAE